MYVYPDQNFLISCVKHTSWLQKVIEADRSGRIDVVFSAWHFYEYGNASQHPQIQELIQFAEELNPKWILERGELQHRELVATWNTIWSGAPFCFYPISSLPEAAAALNRVPVEQMEGYTIRDYITSWSAPGALDELLAELKRQTLAARSNIDKYVNDKRFDAIFPITRLFYVAIQIARTLETKPDRVYALANRLLREQPISTQIECFVYWGCTNLLKSYLAEVAFTLDLYPTRAELSPNRQIDRQHAIAALSYCDLFVTDDVDLTKRCMRVKRELKFQTADVVDGNTFVNIL